MTGDKGRIFICIAKRTAIQATGCDLNLIDLAIFGKGDLFCAALSGIPCIIGVSVVEDIPFAVDLYDASVIVRAISRWLVRVFVCADTQITVADDHTAIGERAFRRIGGGIAELMHDLRRVNKVEYAVSFTDRRRLKEGMSFKIRTARIHRTRNDKLRSFLDREHIRTENSNHGTMTGSIGLSAKTGVQICCVSDGDHTRIKLWFVRFFLSEERAVFVMYMTVEFEGPLRLIALSNGYDTLIVQNIEKVIVSIRSDCYIRSVETALVLLIVRVVRALKGNTFVTPIGQIIYRCRPADIITGAEEGTVKIIV